MRRAERVEGLWMEWEAGDEWQRDPEWRSSRQAGRRVG